MKLHRYEARRVTWQRINKRAQMARIRLAAMRWIVMMLVSDHPDPPSQQSPYRNAYSRRSSRYGDEALRLQAV